MDTKNIKLFSHSYLQLHHSLQSNWITWKWHIYSWRLKPEGKNIAVYFSAAIMAPQLWSKRSTFASLMIWNEDFITRHFIPTVVAKTCGRSPKDMQRNMSETIFFWHSSLLMQIHIPVWLMIFLEQTQDCGKNFFRN